MKKEEEKIKLFARDLFRLEFQTFLCNICSEKIKQSLQYIKISLLFLKHILYTQFY